MIQYKLILNFKGSIKMSNNNCILGIRFFSVVVSIISMMFTLNVKSEPLSVFNPSISNWESEITANLNKTGPIFHTYDELNITEDNSITFALTLENRYSWMPNLKVQRTKFDIHLSTRLNSNITFNGNYFSSGDQLESRINFKHTGYNLYYEILNNDISFDLGITVMKFGGKIQMQSAQLSSVVKLREFVPSGYAKLRYEIPLTSIYMGTEGSMLSMGNNSVTDYIAHIGYENETGLVLEVGYHHFSADWNDFSSSGGDLRINSYYASVDFNF